MRTRLNALLPIFLIAIMLGSVAVPQFSNVSDEPLELEESVVFETQAVLHLQQSLPQGQVKRTKMVNTSQPYQTVDGLSVCRNGPTRR